MWRPKRTDAVAAVAAPLSGSLQVGSGPVSSSSSPVSVGIIGGGVAGLSCARRLTELGLKAVVFDTGKRGPGGRASSRTWRGHVVDHAAQFVVASDPSFSAALHNSGAAVRWANTGRFGSLREGRFSPAADNVERWVGKDGLGSLITAWADNLDVRKDVWVPPSNGIIWQGDHWTVAAPGDSGRREALRFDAVVIAHNGKCAERLTSSTPSSAVHALLRTTFAHSLPANPVPGSGRFTLNQIYSLLIEVPRGVMPSHFDAVFVEDHDSCLRWLSSNSAKTSQKEFAAPDTEAWTVLSSPSFGKRHKAPQEFLEGTEKEKEVTRLMLEGVERATGLKPGSLHRVVLATKLQLWGAALPINRWVPKDGAEYVWDAAHRIGIAGDWLTSVAERASTIEAAWISGARLAEHVVGNSGLDAGLELGPEGGCFVPVDGDFGSAGKGAQACWVAGDSAKGFNGKGSHGKERDGKSHGDAKGVGGKGGSGCSAQTDGTKGKGRWRSGKGDKGDGGHSRRWVRTG